MNKVKWVKEEESDNELAAHPQCTKEEGIEVYVSERELKGFEPIFCLGCHQLIGYYSPTTEPSVVKDLTERVDESFKNAIKNGYDEFMRRADLELVAIDLMDYDVLIEKMVEEFDLSTESVMLAVQVARENNPS